MRRLAALAASLILSLALAPPAAAHRGLNPYAGDRGDWRRMEAVGRIPPIRGLSASRARHGGRRHRSRAAKAAFRADHPCPATGRFTGPCPGFVVDHIQALKHGGADTPDNMQWQTVEAAHAKDRVE